MISYRDMTFCGYYKDCDHRLECPRPLTPEVIKEARKWWGGEDAPISRYSQQPACHSSNNTPSANKRIAVQLS